MTAEQLEASRSERMRQNGHGTITFEDARTWIEETGLCLFLPKRQFAPSTAPSFVEAVAGEHNATPDQKQIALAEELLIRLELDGVVVRLNLLGQPGEQPDFIVAAWVLPYVYALRGDRDWRRNPQLTGSRQVSPLAVQTYKLLEEGDTTVSSLRQALGREVTDAAVMRSIAELWQQLRIIPVIEAPGKAANWQLLRQRFQKAIAEGASTSQVTAISVLASIYLQAVIAATMEEVEVFLSPLTARSKIREVLRGLVATRQVHTTALGHAPHFYVAGTLPEFETAPTIYASSLMGSSAYFLGGDREEEPVEHEVRTLAAEAVTEPAPASVLPEEERLAEPAIAAPAIAQTPKVFKPATAVKAPLHGRFSRPTPPTRDRKPAAGGSHASRHGAGTGHASGSGRTSGHVSGASEARSTSSHVSTSRSSSSRPSSPHSAKPSHAPTSRPAASHGRTSSPSRWSAGAAKGATAKHPSAHAASSSRPASSTHGPSEKSTHSASKPVAHSSRPAGASAHTAKPAPKTSHNGAKPTSKPTTAARNSSAPRGGARKPSLSGAKPSAAGKRFGHAVASRTTGAKKRG